MPQVKDNARMLSRDMESAEESDMSESENPANRKNAYYICLGVFGVVGVVLIAVGVTVALLGPSRDGMKSLKAKPNINAKTLAPREIRPPYAADGREEDAGSKGAPGDNVLSVAQVKEADHVASINTFMIEAPINSSKMMAKVTACTGSSCISSSSCSGRCYTKYTPSAPCQCNSACLSRQNCCEDYIGLCRQYRLGQRAWDAKLLQPSSAPLFTFYVYRAQSEVTYPPENVNMASLGGVLWYIHNELINHCATNRGKGEFGFRRFKTTRILRYKISMKATQPLYDLGMNFGSRVAFDYGKNTGAWEHFKDDLSYYKFGYNVGCNVLGQGPYPLCPSGQGDWEGFCPIEYKNAYWYSFPGKCPTEDLKGKNKLCESELPGGACKTVPTGQGNCTYHWEDAGWINMDDLDGITAKYGSHYEFCKAGCIEYNKFDTKPGANDRDKGRCIDFWNDRKSRQACDGRQEAVRDEFFKKYPTMPRELETPSCDFNRQVFYANLPSS